MNYSLVLQFYPFVAAQMQAQKNRRFAKDVFYKCHFKAPNGFELTCALRFVSA
jgi:hypothetical protein